MDKAKIKNTASELYLKYFKRGIPAEKMLKIIANEGLDYSELDIDLKKAFLGALVKIPDIPLHIMINKNIKPIGRKNFTTAHELGHYALGHYFNSTSFYCNESEIKEEGDAVSEQEKEANYFANCFLLPRERVQKEFTNWYRWKISQNNKVFISISPSDKQSWHIWKVISSRLSSKFKASGAAVKICLVELGLINNFYVKR